MPLHIHEDHLNTSHFTFDTDGLHLSNPPSTAKQVMHLRGNIDFETVSPYTIGSVPANSIITKVIVKILTGFDGTSPAVDIGTSADTDKYLYSGDYVITSPGTHVSHFYEKEAVETAIIATIALGGSTAGTMEIYLEYAQN